MAGRQGCANMATTTLLALALTAALATVVIIVLVEQLGSP